jgi:endogenous inhibitor of DNA gyrase (YacG/DUF329 family)
MSQSVALPFCGERCRTLDLGRWLNEGYSLPHAPDPEADEQPEDPPPGMAPSPASESSI